MYLPWTKDAKAVKLLKQHINLYHKLNNFIYHHSPEVAELQLESNRNQLDKLKLANYALRREFSHLPYSDLPRVPSAPGIVKSIEFIGGYGDVSPESYAYVPKYCNAYTGVATPPLHFRSELVQLAVQAYSNILSKELKALSDKLGVTCTCPTSIVIDNLLTTHPDVPYLGIRTDQDLSRPELEALAYYHCKDILL